MDKRASIATLLADIDSMTPGGFAVGLHVSYNGPQILAQTFPISWIDFYTDNALHLHDPAVAWSFANTGYVRWRDLAENDPGNVIGLAASHGLTHGATLAIKRSGSGSVLGCARQDREYLDAELQEIMAVFEKLHDATLGLNALPAEDKAALKRMSIRLSHS